MCCGGKRQQLRTGLAPVKRAAPVKPQVSAAPPTGAGHAAPLQTTGASSSVYFEYVGKTGLTIDSPTTGRRYRFDHPGAQLPVDPRDQALLLYVPNLRPVRIVHSP